MLRSGSLSELANLFAILGSRINALLQISHILSERDTSNFMHTPLNMGSVIGKTWKQIQDAGADLKEEFAILSCDPSPWKGEHYFSVAKEVPGADNVRLSGTYLTKVFEGSYKEAKNWVKGMEDYVKSKGKRIKKLYFYYTTCPKCAKHYGKNYIVAFAQI